jgi:DNA-binding Lrp family transcriptional regulator
MTMLNPTELDLIDRWQRDFPLEERPFAAAGRSLGLGEAETIETFQRLQRSGVLSRIGAVVKPHTVGVSTLAALRVPPQRLDEVAALVSDEHYVNHNYERAHAYNLWFVVAAPDAGAVAATLARIEEKTGLPVLDLPLVEAYHLDLGFSLSGGQTKRRDAARAVSYRPDALDRALLAAIEEGLPIVARPFESVAQSLGVAEADLLERLQRLTQAGIVTRFGCVVRHRALGYTANAMAVWNIPDERVQDVVRQFLRNPAVSLCYRRRRQPPDWPYNLFCMIHAKTRRDAYAAIDELNLVADTGLCRQSVLFSTRCFKQSGAKFRAREAVN